MPTFTSVNPAPCRVGPSQQGFYRSRPSQSNQKRCPRPDLHGPLRKDLGRDLGANLALRKNPLSQSRLLARRLALHVVAGVFGRGIQLSRSRARPLANWAWGRTRRTKWPKACAMGTQPRATIVERCTLDTRGQRRLGVGKVRGTCQPVHLRRQLTKVTSSAGSSTCTGPAFRACSDSNCSGVLGGTPGKTGRPPGKTSLPARER